MSDVSAVQHYVVEIDGVKHSEHACFVDAIKTGLLLHEQNPEFKIRVRELSEYNSEEAASEVAA
jgi:hypothetical protein